MSWRNRSADGTVTVYSDSYIHSGHRRNSSRRRHRTSRRPRNDEEEVGYVCSVWRSFTDGVSPARGRRVLALCCGFEGDPQLGAMTVVKSLDGTA